MQRACLILADAILMLHALIVLFNVGALPVIWIGHFRGWRFVRAFSFRITHLALIGFVAGESLFGAVCPLTSWEDALRVKAGARPHYHDGYIAHWVHRLLFYDVAQIYFTVGYGLFFVLVVFTLLRIPPRPPAWWRRRP